MYTEIRYEVDEHVSIITIDRPEARSALTSTTYEELADAVATTRARCLVITGADPAFCSDVPGIARVGQLIGREAAAELLHAGRVVTAEEARELRMVSRVVPHDELLAASKDVDRQIAGNPPLTVQALERGLRRALDPDWGDLGRWASTTIGDLFTTEDHKEGVASFLEKREPNYVGR